MADNIPQTKGDFAVRIHAQTRYAGLNGVNALVAETARNRSVSAGNASPRNDVYYRRYGRGELGEEGRGWKTMRTEGGAGDCPILIDRAGCGVVCLFACMFILNKPTPALARLPRGLIKEIITKRRHLEST